MVKTELQIWNNLSLAQQLRIILHCKNVDLTIKEQRITGNKTVTFSKDSPLGLGERRQ